jgi:exosortase O
MSTAASHPRDEYDEPATGLRPVPILVNGLIAALWLWLYWPLRPYLTVIFAREDFRTNQIILIGVLLLLALRAYQANSRWRLDRLPNLVPLPLALALGASLLYLVVERFLDVNTLAAALFGLASYGLFGLWLSPRRWRAGLPAALLLIGALPFGDHMQTFIGYPLRILTATIVRDGLAAAGVASMGVDTILVFENGVSQVDLPCSGVKSLWTGGLFLIAATWIEQRPLNGRWLVTAVLFTVLLFLANLSRVALLVVSGEVLGWRLLATMLHVPLGVLGFVLACAAAVWLLRRQTVKPSHSMEPGWLTAVTRPTPPPIWFIPVLSLTLALMALAYTPRPQTGMAQPPPEWIFPPELATEPMPLQPAELAWLTRDGAESADRRRFEWQGISGSMILIPSRSWRAHHRPERCFEVYGLDLSDSITHLVTADMPVRFVTLGGQNQPNLSATYWFQADGRVTDDYGHRIWSDLARERERWVLVSILFDGIVDPDQPEVQAFYLALREAVSFQLSAVSQR